MIKTPYNLCLFDLDGTLTDPKLGITKSFRYALSAFGIQEELADLTKLIGPPLRETFRMTYGFSESDTEKAVAEYREYFAETGLFENALYPQIPKILQKLKDSEVTLAVATSKAAFYANKILKHFNINDYFAFVSGDAMDGSLTKNGKGDIIRVVLDALDPGRKMSPVMIGDRKHDITGAREVGIDSIGITWGYGSRDELESAGAAWIADSASELYCLITGESVNL
jgi:phosphoglycolate phosphatase